MSVTLTRIQPGMDQATMAAVINENFLALEQMSIQHTVKDKTGVTRILLGQGGDNFAGLKVSKPTFDVNKATASELIFSSDNNVFKIVRTDTVTVTRSAGTSVGSNSISYSDLGFVPAFLAFSSSTPLPIVSTDTSGGSAGVITQKIDAVINTFTEEITFRIIAPDFIGNTIRTLGANATIRYYLLQETAN